MIMSPVLRVTLDTNALDRIDEIRMATAGLEIEIAVTTVTTREKADAGQLVGTQVYETAVLGESRLDTCVLGGDDAPSRLESILDTLSSRSFPPPGNREALAGGERRQLRDAMILEAHVRAGRDILVTQDLKAFGGPGSPRRATLEATWKTEIMTVDEFCGRTTAIPAAGTPATDVRGSL